MMHYNWFVTEYRYPYNSGIEENTTVATMPDRKSVFICKSDIPQQGNLRIILKKEGS